MLGVVRGWNRISRKSLSEAPFPTARGSRPSAQSARCRAETGPSSRFPMARRGSARGRRAAAPGGERLGEGHLKVGAQAQLGARRKRVSGSSSLEEAGLPRKA